MFTKLVRQFTRACEINLPKRPRLLSKETIDFITKMVSDEMQELKCADDIKEQADALVDAIYYIYDTAVKNGIDLDPIFKIVHRANMKKVVKGKVIRGENGKVLKPANWQDPAPLIAKEIKRQLLK